MALGTSRSTGLQEVQGERQPLAVDTLHRAVFSDLVTEIGRDPHPFADALVMIVDDEPTNIDVIQYYLENAGHQHFVTTTEPTEAVELVRSRRPDVVLLDVNMPGLSGFEILEQLRADDELKQCRVIILTASTEADAKLKALQLGVSDFLEKPADPSELTLRVSNTLTTKAYQDRLTYYDGLTGLPNRRMFTDRLEGMLGWARDTGSIMAILVVNLDRFKKINDTLDHEIGDALLKLVGARLEGCLRMTDFVARPGRGAKRPNLARIGGDEFGVVLTQLAHSEDADVVARRIQSVLETPFEVDGQDLFVSASLGISVYPDDGDSCKNLLKHADVALTHAKEQGRNNFQFYSSKLNEQSHFRLSMETDLRKALERDELVLHYQPKVDVATGRIVGCEALLRWQRVDGGMVSPMDFIPLAEETGLIVPFGEWVAHAACRQGRAWDNAGLGPLGVAINISSQQFRQGELALMVVEAIDGSGLDPERLTVELTENAILERAERNVETLHQLRAMGTKIAIDDFGTGYSSLSYLTQFPFDELKIDRSFIRPISLEQTDAPIVNAIMAMASSLGLSVVAEGVETDFQLDYIARLGCESYQGFFFSKPLPAHEFTELLRQQPVTAGGDQTKLPC